MTPTREARAVPSDAAPAAPAGRPADRPGPLGLWQRLDTEGRLVGGRPAVTSQRLVELYSAMVRLRILDTRMLNLQRQGRIGFYGMTTGEEAAVIGSAAGLEPADWIFPALRQGGAALLRGADLTAVIAQNLGNARDLVKGRQMPCHFSDRRLNHVSWSSVIGTQLPQATGAAYAAKLRKDPIVVAAYLGDGATSGTDFHVALNFAAVWQVPVVFICQNNQWAISVPLASQTASETIAVKSIAYGMPGVRCDGNDLVAVYETVQTAVDRARAGDGPTLVECVTFRRLGHSSSDDPTRYRASGEVDEWSRRDPIDRVRKYLDREGLWDEKRQQALETRLNDEISRAIEEAEKAAPLAVETLFDDVYAAPLPPHLADQREALLREQEARRAEGFGTVEGRMPL